MRRELTIIQQRYLRALRELDISFAEALWDFHGMTGAPTSPDVKLAAMHKARVHSTFAGLLSSRERRTSREWLRLHGFTEEI